MARVLSAFLLSPAAVVLVLGALAFAWLSPAQGRDTVFVLITFVLPVAYMSSLLFGLPLYILCKRHGWLSWWHSLVGGLLCAVPYSAFLLYGNPLSYSVQVLVGFCFAVGALVGVTFWAFGIRN